MEQLLQRIISFPPHPPPIVPLPDPTYDTGIKDQIAFVRATSKKSLLQKTSGGEELIDVRYMMIDWNMKQKDAN